MKPAIFCLAFLAVFFMVGVCPGESLKCYYCVTGSKLDYADECREPKKHADKLLVECNTTAPFTDKPFKYCRTLKQNVEGEERIVRGCATDGRTDRCIERTGTKDIQAEYCECEGDGCNAASPVIASLLTFFASTLLALLVAS